MSGLYIHIPFCRQACHYCNFHFSTYRKLQDELVDALLLEMEIRKDYLSTPHLDSVYFGGGTPSLLTPAQLERIFNSISKHFVLGPDPEITLEANPDDLSPDAIEALRTFPVNRLSIGIQSFRNEDLKFMNRAHSAVQAKKSIERALEAGFSNMTIDLIYGTPTLSDEHWAENLRIAVDYGIPHLSAYALTVEEKTALAHFIEKGKVPPPSEKDTSRQFFHMVNFLSKRGFSQYEISNFALPGREARHNSSYWGGAAYLGIGPGAHSYNGYSRQWNISNNPLYIKAVCSGNSFFKKEILTEKDQFNEYLLTRLRTSKGCDKVFMKNAFPTFYPAFTQGMESFVDAGQATETETAYFLTLEGKLFADRIAMELFA